MISLVDLLMPPTKLVTDFGQFYIAKSIVLHANTEILKLNLLKVAKEINKERHYFVIQNIDENCTINLQNVDLHLGILNDNEDINYFVDCFNHR